MIGKKLRKMLYKRKKTVTGFAREMDISPSRLSNYLSDKREPTLEMLAKMARALDTDLNYFSPYNED